MLIWNNLYYIRELMLIFLYNSGIVDIWENALILGDAAQVLWEKCHHICNSLSNGLGGKMCVYIWKNKAHVAKILTLLNLGQG